MATAKEGAAKNRSQFVSFRVFVYRLNLPGSFPISDEIKPLSFYDIFYMDSAEPLYSLLSRAMEDDGKLKDFIENVRSKIDTGLSGPPRKMLEPGSIFQRVDITPLVTSVSTSLDINGNNSCSIAMSDEALPDFGLSNIDASQRMGPLYRQVGELPPDRRLSASAQLKQQKDRANAEAGMAADRLDALRGFSIREFDLVRVEIFARDDESWMDRAEGFLRVNLSPEYTSTTAFTGIVVDISRAASPNSVPSVNVNCAGMSVVLGRGTIVFNKAMSQVITLKGGKNLKVINKDINIYANAFSNSSSLGAFLEIINDYFLIRDPGSTARTSGNSVDDVKNAKPFYMPDIRPEFWKRVLTFVDEEKNDRPALIQFLPVLVCYHILKYLNLEPIAVLDDLLADDRGFIDDPGESAKLTTSVPVGRDKALAMLKPYLLMTRTAYEGFDSSFMEPASVFNEIRAKAFFEIFEDRSGAFHFRFPRYNHSVMMHTCDEFNTISSSVSKSDSGVFNVSQVETSAAFIGVLAERGLLAGINFDRFSIFRYGMRMPQKVENPNALVPELSSAIARFLSGYNSALSSRTATVVRTIRPSINVGEMVRFQVGRRDKTSLGPVQGGEPTHFVGYVASIAESVSVSGVSSQTLGLTMVRPIGPEFRIFDGTAQVTLRQAATLIRREPVSGAREVRRVDLPGSALDFNLGTRAVRRFSYGSTALVGGVQILQGNALDSAEDLNSGLAGDISNLTVSTSFLSLGASSAIFKYIPDPFQIAEQAGASQQDINNAIASLRGQDPKKMTERQRKDAIAAADSSVEKRAQALASGIVYGQFLSRYIDGLRARIASRGLASIGTPGQSVDSSVLVRAYGDEITRTYSDVFREFRSNLAANGASVTLQFPGDLVARTPNVFTWQIDHSLDEVVSRASLLFLGTGKRKGSEWYKKQFDYLFRSPSGVVFSDEDRKSAQIIYEHLLFALSEIVSLHSVERANNDREAAARVKFLNDTREKMAAARSLPKTAPASQGGVDITGAGNAGPPIAFGVQKLPSRNVIEGA